jgi:H-type lectin domain./Domain of unknown function (DUF2479).
LEKYNYMFLGEFGIGLKEQHKSTHREIRTQDINSVTFAFTLARDGKRIELDYITLLIVLPNETKVVLQGVYDEEEKMYVTEYFDTSVITNRSKQRAFGYLYGETENEGTKGYDIGSFSFFVGTSAIDKPLKEAESTYVPQFKQLYDELYNLGVKDAPSDAKMYGRKDGNWEEIVSDGGMTEDRVKEIVVEEIAELDRPNIQSDRVYLFGYFPEGLRGEIVFPKEFKTIPVVSPVYQGDGSLDILPIVQAYGVTTHKFEFLINDMNGNHNFNAFMNWVAIES